MNTPTAAPAYWPYREHRTCAEWLFSPPKERIGGWAEVEDRTLRDFRSAGHSWGQAALALDRSVNACQARWKKIGRRPALMNEAPAGLRPSGIDRAQGEE